MRTWAGRAGGRRGIGPVVLIAALVAAVALAGLALAACGGASITGDYKFDTGTEKQMAEFTLTLNDDDTFKLAGPNPLGGGDVTIDGTYTVDGDKISLKMSDGSESDPGTIDGDKLVFEDVTWVKQ
jgi:hypothetical protein